MSDKPIPRRLFLKKAGAAGTAAATGLAAASPPLVAQTVTARPAARSADLIYPGGGPGRARQALNADTIREMHRAFGRGGRKMIEKVMRQQPAVFLKLLVLLVPRELKIETTGGVKSMTDEQLEQGIEAITAMLAARDAGANAKVIEGKAEVPAIPATPKVKRKVRKSDRLVGPGVGTADESGNS